MKLFLILFFTFLFILSVSLRAQVPNGDFESWNNGEPVGWYTNNFVGLVTTVTQTSDAHGGSSALRGESVIFNDNVYYSLIISGKIGEKGFPVTQKYAQLSGYYKLLSNNSENLNVLVTMYGNGNFMGVGGLQFPAVSAYTNFIVPILYNNLPGIPDSCQISVTFGNDTASVHSGAVFFLDDFTLEGTATSVEQTSQISSYELYQNYPNPFNPSTNIAYQLPQDGFVTLKIFDMLGNEIETLVNEKKAAGQYIVEFNAGEKNLASGVYFYQLTIKNEQLTSKGFSSTKKLILLQ